MPAYPHIQRYRAELSRLAEFGGSANESSIRRAFATCLDAYCRDQSLALVDELVYRGGVYPDGTVKGRPPNVARLLGSQRQLRRP